MDRIRGIAIPFGRANVDTDLIIPSQYMKTVGREGLGKGAFAPLRGEPGNMFAEPRHADAPILIAGANFGCGSSREHAVWALIDMGLKAVIAPSFGEIFENNALRNGLLAARVAEPEVGTLMAEARDGEVEIDVEAGIVTSPGGARFRFALDPFRRRCLIEGLDELALTESHAPAIAAFEERQASERPWLAALAAGREEEVAE
jgi:3-isopropylmalate/(R)-2-methylmalate dehydratase small subunit